MWVNRVGVFAVSATASRLKWMWRERVFDICASKGVLMFLGSVM